jgi:RNA polymerase sigma-70 factor (ECF subfamily)
MLAVMFRGAPSDIPDAEQEVFAALYSSLAKFRGQSSLATFVYRLCRNTAIDAVRRGVRERRRLLAAARAAGAGHGPAADRVVDPEVELARGETRRRVGEALARLPLVERMLVLMKDCEDMSLAEIASALGMPEGTVKSRLHRTRARLARMLGGEL